MTGQELRQAINNPPPIREFLVEDFLPERTVIIITGETGKGKSVIATQLALSLTSATSLFGKLVIPKPRKVYYIAMEGDREDHLERIRFMEQVAPLNTDNLFWDQDYFFNTKDIQQVRTKLNKIKTIWQEGPDLVIIDPIYKAVSEDLSKAESAKALIMFSDLLRSSFKCCVGYIHHLHREKYNFKGDRIDETHAYYGHSYLMNHTGLSYIFKPIDELGEKSQLIRKKSNSQKELEVINLVYHPETFTCSMVSLEEVTKGTTKTERVESFLRNLATMNEMTDFYEVKEACHVSDSFLRGLQARYVKEHKLIVQQGTNERHIWIPTKQLLSTVSGKSDTVSFS